MKNYYLTFLLFLSIGCSSQTSELNMFVENIQKQYNTSEIVLKNIATSDDYYKDYIVFLSDKINQQIIFENPKNIAFDLIIDDDIYKINLLTFNILNSKVDFQSTGQFNTKALISYYFVMKKGKGYLLLFNKFVTNEIIRKIISILNTNCLKSKDK